MICFIVSSSIAQRTNGIDKVGAATEQPRNWKCSKPHPSALDIKLCNRLTLLCIPRCASVHFLVRDIECVRPPRACLRMRLPNCLSDYVRLVARSLHYPSVRSFLFVLSHVDATVHSRLHILQLETVTTTEMKAFASAPHANIDPIDVLLEVPFKSMKEDRMTVIVKFHPAVMEFVKSVWAQYTTSGIDTAPEPTKGICSPSSVLVAVVWRWFGFPSDWKDIMIITIYHV